MTGSCPKQTLFGTSIYASTFESPNPLQDSHIVCDQQLPYRHSTLEKGTFVEYRGTGHQICKRKARPEVTQPSVYFLSIDSVILLAA